MRLFWAFYCLDGYGEDWISYGCEETNIQGVFGLKIAPRKG